MGRGGTRPYLYADAEGESGIHVFQNAQTGRRSAASLPGEIMGRGGTRPYRADSRPAARATGLGTPERDAFCGWTGFGLRSMYVFMVSVFLSSIVTDASPTTCGSAPFARCNPRSLRRADTAFTFIASHTV